MNQSITLTQLWLAVAFPSALSLAGLTITCISVITNNSRLSDLKADIMHLAGRMDTLIGVVNDIDKRLVKLEVKQSQS